MFELVHVSIKVISNTCSVQFNLPKFHKKTFDMLEWVHLSFKLTTNTCIVVFNVLNLFRIWTHSMEAHNYGVQTLDKNDWYQVRHLAKCAFETNAAIAQLSIRPYYSYLWKQCIKSSVYNQYTLNNHLMCLK